MPAENPAADVVNYQTEDEQDYDMGPVGEFTDLICKDNPTHMGHFGDVVNDELKQFIVDCGTCRPKGRSQRMKVRKIEHFLVLTITWYLKLAYQSKLTDLPILQFFVVPIATCEPCWLFADRTDPHYNRAWSTGVRKWKQNFTKKSKSMHLQRHTFSRVMVFEQWKRHRTVADLADNQSQTENAFWSEVLKRLIKITLMLVKNRLAFSGHTEHIDDKYNGNFLSMVKLLAEFDPMAIMHELLKRPSGTVEYT